jgi:Arc/MetJ family transcription regulator
MRRVAGVQEPGGLLQLSGRARHSRDSWCTYRTRCVYSWCMARIRTNIEIDDVYVRRIMDRYGIHTKTEAVDLALRHLAGQPMTHEEALAMAGAQAIGEIPPDRNPFGEQG